MNQIVLVYICIPGSLITIQVLFLGKTDDTNVLPLPKLLHGEYDDEAQNGVMVFTDYRENHYELADSDLKRISSQNQIEKVISTLAAFHSICTAFEQSHGSSFERIFPFLSTDQGNKKSDNLQYNTLVRWFARTNDLLTKHLMF